MILIIDNYDSFTYNLVQCIGALGHESEVVRNDHPSLRSPASSEYDAIVISPGPCTPREAGFSVELIRRESGRLPILGICLGHQAIAAAFGATVVARRPVVHGKTSRVRHDGATPFDGLPSPLQVARYHSLVVDDATLPPSLLPCAHTTDDGILMAFRHVEHPTYGIQFHPESFMTPEGPAILDNFLRSHACPRPLARPTMPTA